MAAPLGGKMLPFIRRELFRGLSNRAICESTGAHRKTIAGVRRRLGISAVCKCGKAAGHGGRCWWRDERRPENKGRGGKPLKLFRGLSVEHIVSREHTYKSEELARRSFYRFVCKCGLYRALEIKRDRAGSVVHFRPAFRIWSGTYKRGYPAWTANILRESTPSTAVRMWRSEFDSHAEEIKRIALESDKSERRLSLVSNERTRSFFQFASAGMAISR